MFLDFLIIIIAVRYLQKLLDTAGKLPEWHSIFRITIIASAVLIGLDFLMKQQFTIWLGKAALIAFVFLLIQKEELKAGKPLLPVLLPYVVVSTAKLVAHDFFPEFYSKWDNTWNLALTFSVLWGFGAWVISAKQRRELVRSKRKIAEQEERNLLMAQMKEELEKQVRERTMELTHRKNELEQTLNELKSTQSQLIHSEKMASLGELTAGVAHEIQNPLNFVNNFSEVNIELIAELKDAIGNGNYGEAMELANDLNDNEAKIFHHGKRADGIVKGMLQHSRASSGQKEPIDVNALSEEYMRLAYHGLRAKDKSFNATMKLDLDPTLTSDKEGRGKVMLMGQEVGRVILNLLTNAFYSVKKQKAEIEKSNNAEHSFSPMVGISTERQGDTVKVTVSDNGNGISRAHLEKIFQPFFTTKPPGEGTGLGLSLSYEIITKGHGGKVSVVTKNGEGTFSLVDGVVRPVPEHMETEALRSQPSGTIFIISIPTS